MNSAGTGRKMAWTMSQGALSSIPGFVSTVIFYKHLKSLDLRFPIYEREGPVACWDHF